MDTKPSVEARRPREAGGPEPHLQLTGLVKTFDRTRAVDGVSLDIHRGEFFALLGPSGCGKTTLLRMLAGFEEPDEGRILLGGEDLTGVPPHRRPVNMMFQAYALFPHMTVEKNIAFGLQMEGMSRAARRARVEEMLALTRLEGMARRRPEQLSGGQRQRVALARALAKKPKLLLLDEPLGALDRKLREATQLELVKIQQELGTTFVIVTHDQEEAMTVSTRLAVMGEGRIAQLGEPREVYESPASRYVAEFIGDVNVLEGRVDPVDPARVALDDGGTARLPEPPGEGGARIALALRPEKIALDRADGPTEPAENTLSGTVEEIAYFGGISMFHIRLDGAGVVKVSRTNRDRALATPLRAGDAVRLGWEPSALVPLTD